MNRGRVDDDNAAAADDDPLSSLFTGLSVDAEKPPDADAAPSATHEWPDVPLRDYQSALLDDADKLFRGGERAVLAYLPTGGGKTRVGAAAMAGWVPATASTTRQRSLFVVNRRSLLQQTVDALVEVGFARDIIGLIGGEAAPPDDRALIHVAMIQSLHDRFRSAHAEAHYGEAWGEGYALAIIDESHGTPPSHPAL